MDEVLSMAERVAVMEHGRIRQLDTPRNLYEVPQNRFVADFVGRMNIFPVGPINVDGKNRRYAVEGLGEIAAADENPAAAFLAIRPPTSGHRQQRRVQGQFRSTAQGQRHHASMDLSENAEDERALRALQPHPTGAVCGLSRKSSV